MRRTSYALVGLTLLALAVWLGQRSSSVRESSETTPPEAAVSNSPPSLSAFFQRKARVPRASSSAAPLDAGESSLLPQLAPEVWAEEREAILSSTQPSSEKATWLLRLLPQVPALEQAEAAQHLANLLEDDQVWQAAGYLTNATASPVVLEVLLADLSNRPESVRLPLWLQIAQTPKHPEAEVVRRRLANTLPEDHGSDWKAWAAAVQARLQTNP